MTPFLKSPIGLGMTVLGLYLGFKIYRATMSAIKGDIRFRFSTPGPYAPGAMVSGQLLIRARYKIPAERIVLRIFCEEGNVTLNTSNSYGRGRALDLLLGRDKQSVGVTVHDQLLFAKDYTLYNQVQLPTHGSLVVPFSIQIPQGVIRPGVGMNPFLDPNYEEKLHAHFHPHHATSTNFKGKVNWYLEARVEIPGVDLMERLPIKVNLAPNDGAFFG